MFCSAQKDSYSYKINKINMYIKNYNSKIERLDTLFLTQLYINIKCNNIMAMATKVYKIIMTNIKCSIIILIITLSTTFYIYPQDSINHLTNKTMEKFDIEKFKSITMKGVKRYSEIKNDTIVEMADLNDVYSKNTRTINSPYINKKTYYKDNYQLKAEVNYFYMFPIGIGKKYDSEGNVIETKNWDVKYPFSVDQLIDKMKNDFDIDLIKTSNIGVARYFDNNIYIYSVIIPYQGYTNEVREIKLNGSNGDVISDRIKYLQK